MRNAISRASVVVGAAALVACSSSSEVTSDGGGADVRADVTLRDSGGDGPITDSGPDSPKAEAGGPSLSMLSVTGPAAPDASAPLGLVPAFSPAIHDYYVRCAAATNELKVSMTASPGSLSSLQQPSTSPAKATQTLSVSVAANQAIVAVATEGAASTPYWVRCLPTDFPAFTWTPHPAAGSPTPGYYLVGDIERGGKTTYAMILDSNGVPVWYYQEKAAGVINVQSLEDASVSFTGWSYSPYQVDDLATGKTLDITVPDRDEHELQLLSNGDYVLIANPLVANVNLSGLTISEPDGGMTPLGKNEYILNCVLNEVDAKGKIVWSWTATDHMDPRVDCTWPQPAPQQAPDGGGLVVDAFHCNSIDVDPKNGNLLVSSRAMDSVFYIDKTTGNILWKMGGVAATKDPSGYVPVKDAFFRQHDARLQPGWQSDCRGGSGQISMFDDETDLPGPARAVLYDVDVHLDAGADCGAAAGDGGASGGKVAWQRPGMVPSLSMGSFRISPDGSRVIGWGNGGFPNLIFTEVTDAGADELDLYLTNDEYSYRAIKVPLTSFTLDELRNGVGKP